MRLRARGQAEHRNGFDTIVVTKRTTAITMESNDRHVHSSDRSNTPLRQSPSGTQRPAAPLHGRSEREVGRGLFFVERPMILCLGGPGDASAVGHE